MLCVKCGDDFEAEDMTQSGACRFCERRGKHAEFARSCGLSRFPDPTGERYVYHVDGGCTGKKGENEDIIDELWDALARALGREDLTIGGGS